ncbi:MAG: DUF2914 domain-containing protein [Trichloromonadaceae bacterium]
MRGTVVAGLIGLLLLTGGFATVARALEVVEAAISTGVVDHLPIDFVEAYTVKAGKLYCFTRVLGSAGRDKVIHIWRREGQEMARIELPLRSDDFRTWSVKTIQPTWSGKWQVDVVDNAGTVLVSLPFVLQ